MVDFSQQTISDEKSVSDSISSRLTMDKIIEKFIPIVGAVFLIIGFTYLVYTTAWIVLPMVARLGLGFFLSVLIIGGSFSFSEKLRYLTDVGIGSGVLLFYGTLIYGSRTTDVTAAVIPEVATLVTAFIFMIAVAFFASKRNSKVVIILGMIGAYITPFVIGQNDVWVQNISFNAYLIYFTAINASVLVLGSEISVRNIIPLNIIGLFVGTTFLYYLSYYSGISRIAADNFFTSEIFTALLLMIMVVFLTWSILLSARKFEEKDDGYLALGYLAPIIWFAYNIGKLEAISNMLEGILYALIAASCFLGWHHLLQYKSRFQHGALYAAGVLSAVLAFFAFFPELDVYTSIFIAYLSLIFGILYMMNPGNSERFVSFGLASLMGSYLSIIHILDTPELPYRSLHVVIALLPAMSAFVIAKKGGRSEFIPISKFYSFVAFIIASMFVLGDLIDYININFLLFFIAPLFTLGFILFFNRHSKDQASHDTKSILLRVVLIWFAFGFISTFVLLIASIYPAPDDIFLFTHTDLPTDWILVKGIFATIILFFGLTISRRLQAEQTQKRPSFILVIFGYATLLLTGNYIIYALMNDLEMPMVHGGARALGSTLWWLAVTIYMLFIGIMRGKRHHSEKLLGLILLAITITKILFYDLSMMEVRNKVLILVSVGFGLLIFSYGIHSKNLLAERKSQE